MPRKNNRPRPPEQRTHQLDSFTMWAENIAENRPTQTAQQIAARYAHVLDESEMERPEL